MICNLPEELDFNKVYNCDCLIGMKLIKDKSVDMICCDLPYNTTDCEWDTLIPFDQLWEQYERIIKDNGAIILFGSEPFSSYLRMSKIKLYRYDWIWNKQKAGNFVLGNKMPLKIHETISVFYKKLPTYNPQKTKNPKERGEAERYKRSLGKSEIAKISSGIIKSSENYDRFLLLPTSILSYKKEYGDKLIHPTQKPLELVEYLIKTYSNENELVLDNCMGSFTTAEACLNTNRNFIGFEMDEVFFNLGQDRIKKWSKSVSAKANKNNIFF